jgi:PilZ domain
MRILARRRATQGPIRAQRVPLQTDVEFRRLNDTEWHRGTTENISCTGLLLRTRAALEADVPLSIKLLCPAKVCGTSAPQIVARGHVTRQVKTGSGWLVAVAVAEYRVGKVPIAITDDIARPAGGNDATQHRLLQLLTIVQGAADILALSSRDADLLSWINKIRYAATEATTLARGAVVGALPGRR